jgi:hypothetical protein
MRLAFTYPAKACRRPRSPAHKEARMVRELTMQHLSPTADIAIVRKARDLMAQAAAGLETAESLEKLSEGFLGLSHLADARREFRMACVSKALSDIFKRFPEGNPDDLPFMVHVAMNFLQAIQAPGAADGRYEP